MKFLIKQRLISIILFFVISFFSTLPQMHPFIDIAERGSFTIGVPFPCYYEIIDAIYFSVGSERFVHGLYIDMAFCDLDKLDLSTLETRINQL